MPSSIEARFKSASAASTEVAFAADGAAAGVVVDGAAAVGDGVWVAWRPAR
jgi:hypothetical protein